VQKHLQQKIQYVSSTHYEQPNYSVHCLKITKNAISTSLTIVAKGLLSVAIERAKDD